MADRVYRLIEVDPRELAPPGSTQASPDPSPLLLTVEQAATKLGLPIARVRDAIATGHLLAVKIGRSHRIPLHAVEQYVERLCADAPTVSRPSGDETMIRAGAAFVKPVARRGRPRD